MRESSLAAPVAAALATALIAAGASAQDLQPGANFAAKPTAVPNATSFAEAARLADFDKDGDLDALMTQGGLFGQLQSQLWTSNSSTAGGAFVFTNTTAANFPAFVASTLGAEAFDLEGDGDLDLIFANTTQLLIESNHWLVNQGGAQGGTAGVFLLDQGRYLGLGAAGSSIAPSLVLGSGPFAGGFADWSAACDFADVDMDGDLDLFQTSVGPGFSGGAMHRLFLNNGTGHFAEYNPSAAVSGASALAAGSAAGWSEGIQAANTTDTTGASHDIATVAFDADFGDIDGDFDLDLAVNDRASQMRMYQNRFVENGLSLGSEGAGTRLYRDVSAAALQALQSGGASMDLEFGDLDLDNDLDLWAINYTNDQDRILVNDGFGAFTSLGSPQGDPSEDENEVDFIDYDADGDLDAFVSNFQGTNFLYKNLAAQGGPVSPASALMKRTSVLGVESELAAPGTVGDSWLSADVGDLDGDKDSDLLVSNDGAGTSAAVHVNTLGVPDLVAPKIPKVGILGGVAPAGSKARVAAAQVFDNDANERLRDATAVLKFQINGGPVATTPARWSGGNLFRGTIPGYWFGTIQWWFEVTDRNANKGSSTVQNLNVASAGLANYGFGTPGCSGPQVMSANSVACPGNGDFQLRTTRCPPSALNLVLQSPTADVAGSDPLFLGITLHIGLFDPNLFALDMVSDPTGLGITPIPFPNDPSLVGYTGNFQTISLWTGPCTPSQLGLSTSNALAVTVQP